MAILKELQQNKSEIQNLQTNYRTLNKKFSQTIFEKDAQISKLEQSIVC
jgi:hypothetical protein